MNQNALQLIVESVASPSSSTRSSSAHRLSSIRPARERGCEDVTFFQVNEDAERFVFMARFPDVDSLEEYFEASWRQEATSQLADLLVEPPRRFTLKRVA